MRIFKSTIIIIFSIIMSVILIENGHCQWRKPKPKPKVIRKRAVKKKSIAKKRKYYSTHDVNNDGKVDLKDRLIWLRRNKGTYGTVLISKKNKGLYGVMDANSDGNVDAVEMNRFYEKYDLDNNGLLEDEEIEAATK